MPIIFHALMVQSGFGMKRMHALLVSRDADYTGVLLILDHLYSLALVVALFGVGAMIGGRILRQLRVQHADPLEHLLFAVALGHAGLATAILVTGLLSGLQPLLLLLIVLVPVWLTRTELTHLRALVRDARRSVGQHLGALALGVSAAVFACVTVVALGPASDWDSLMYHLRLPDQFLDAGSIYRPEDNGHVAFVGLPHMLYLLLLAAGSASAPAVVSAWYTMALGLAVFVVARRTLGDRTARTSVAGFWGSGVILLVAVTPRVDTILAFYLFLVHRALLSARDGDVDKKLILAGLLGGAAVGVKYTALLYLLTLAPMGLWLLLRRADRVMATTALLGIVTLAAALPWLGKNAILLGDPLYPYLIGAPPEPWLSRILERQSWASLMDSGLGEQLARAQGRFDVVDLFVAPERFSVEQEGSGYAPTLLLLLLPLALACRERWLLAGLAMPALAYVALVVVLQPATSIRYLVPAMAPLSIVAAHALEATADRLRRPAIARRVVISVIILTLLPVAMRAFRSAPGRSLAHLFGMVSRHDMLRARTGGYADAVRMINETLTPNSRLLMLWDARGYYLTVPALQDNGIVNWPLLASRALTSQCLRGTGITHVLINEGALDYYTRRGLNTAVLRRQDLIRFVEMCLTPLYTSGGISVYSLATTDGGR